MREGGRLAQRSTTEAAALDGDILVRFDAIYGRADPVEGPRKLLMAVLEEGVRTLTVNARGTGARARRLRGEALRWLLDPDASHLFAYVRICEALGLDAGRLRRRVLSTLPG